MGQQSKASSSEEEQEGSKSPARAIKKLRLKPGESAESEPIWEAKKPVYTATRWDRRKSFLPRKKLSRTSNDHEDMEPATEPDNQNQTGAAEDISVLMPELTSDVEGGDSSHDCPAEAIEAQMSIVADLHEDGAETCSTDQEFGEKSESYQEEIAFSSAKSLSSPASTPARSTSHALGVSTMEDGPSIEDALGSPNVQERQVTKQEMDINSQYPLGQSSLLENLDSLTAHDTGSISEEHAPNTIEPDTEQSVSDIRTNGGDKPEIIAGEPSKEITHAIEETKEKMLDQSCPSFGLRLNADDNVDTHMLQLKESVPDTIPLRNAEASGAAFAQISNSPARENADQLMYAPDVGKDVDMTSTSEQPAIFVDDMEEINDQKQPELVLRGLETSTTKELLAQAEAHESVPEEGVALSTIPLSSESGNEQLSEILQYDAVPEGIADGLTLGSSTQAKMASISSTEKATRKLRSPSPPALEATQEDITTHLDDDTAILKDFLTRAAASKANKANKIETIARRTSLSHRRDSDAVRHALASPRKILEDKDPNSPSPHMSYDTTATLDLTESLTLDQHTSTASDDHESIDTEVAKTPATSSRRSTRSRSSRIPHPPPSHNPQQQTPNRIPVRRADGSEPVVLRRTEAQELGILTRANTRKNKGNAVVASVRLLKLAAEQAVVAGSTVDEAVEAARDGASSGERRAVRWDETLVYFQHKPDSSSSSVEGVTELTEAATQGKADVEMVDSTADELASVDAVASIPKPKSKSKDKATSTPRIRRLRGLGAANGTPGKGLLAPASLLPAEVLEEKEKSVTEVSRLAKPTRQKKLPVASEVTNLPEIQPSKPEQEMNVQAEKGVKERKSRLATPRKVKIPVSTTPAVPLDGKENRLTGGTPKKGVGIAVGVETWLPRRRGAKRL